MAPSTVGPIAIDAAGSVLVTSNDTFASLFAATGTSVWSTPISGRVTPYAIAAGPSGGSAVVGTFGDAIMNTISYSGSSGTAFLTSAGGADVFVVKLDDTGLPLWAKSFGDDKDIQWAFGSVVDALGNIVVTGMFQGALNFGGGPLTALGISDVFLTKLDSSGNHIWSKRFGGGWAAMGLSVATDTSGRVYLLANAGQPVDFGGGAAVDAGIVLASYDSNGNYLWSKSYGEAASSGAVNVGPQGEIIVALSCSGTVDFGGGALADGGGIDVCLARLGAGGEHVWSKRFGGTLDQGAKALSVAPSGNIAISGEFAGQIDLGGGTMTSAGKRDIYVAEFDPSGKHLWSRGFGNAEEDLSGGVAMDGAGHLFLSGSVIGTIDFGGGDFVASQPQATTGFLASFVVP